MANILVIAQLYEGEVKKATYSGVTFAKKVAEATGGSFSILALGGGLDNAGAELAKYGAAKVILADDEKLSNYVAEVWAPTVKKVFDEGGFDVLAMTATSTGKELLPRIAEKLEAGVASDICGIDVEGGDIIYKRPVYAGNIVAHMKIETPKHVVTVRQSEFDPAGQVDGGSPVEKAGMADPDPAAAGVEFIAFEPTVSARPELTDARVIVSGGRGCKSKEGFNTVEELADLLGGAVGATRAAVDAGFIENEYQVGQTGKIVAPELYIALGLSGALQHLAGMKSSKVIVAVNKDEEAPIFQVSDYGIVGDLFKVVPEMIEEIKKVAK